MQLTRRDMLKTGVACLTLPALIPSLTPKPGKIFDTSPPSNNIAEKLYKERINRRRKLLPKWQKLIECSPIQLELAQLLENQYNQNTREKELFAITINAFRESALQELIDIQALDKCADLIFWKDNESHLQVNGIYAESIKSRCTWCYEAISDLRNIHGLDATAELVAVLSQELQTELFRMVITDIRFSAAEKIATPHWHGTMRARILQQITSKCPSVNWIITSPELKDDVLKLCWSYSDAPMLSPTGMEELTLGPRLVEQFTSSSYATWRCNVYVDPLFPAHQILMGCKRHLQGYIFAPFVTEISPITWPGQRSWLRSPKACLMDLLPRRSFYHYFGKRMINPEFYTLINCQKEYQS